MPKTDPRQKPFPQDDKAESKEKGNGYARPTFVRCDLSVEQKREMAEWANSRNADDLLNYIIESVTEGYTASLKTADVGYQGSLTQGRPAGVGVPNAGKSLVTRASTPERTIWALYYKHTQVLEKDWSRASEESTLEW